METIKIKVTALILFLFLSASALYAQPTDSLNNQKEKNDSVASMEKFRQELSTKGQWIKVDTTEIDAENTDENGQIDEDVNRDYIWRPDNVDADWNPYTYGCWQYTSCGWMWISYYDFGWTTCHYGRWWYSPEYGWVWSPGYIWGPAWVSWCYNDGYCGWYPLSPRCHWGYGHHYDISHHHWNDRNWTFVHYKDFTRTVSHTTLVAGDKNKDFLKHSPPVNDINIQKNGIVTNEGPNRSDIEKSSGTKVKQVNVDNFSAGNKGRVKNGSENTRTDNSRSGITRNDNTKVKSNENGYKNRNDGNKGYKTNDGNKRSGNKTWGNRNRGNGTYKSHNGNSSRGSHKSGHSKSSSDKKSGSHNKK